LARANAALLLEHHNGVHHADAYLAGTTVLERLRRSKREGAGIARARRRTDLPAIVISTNRLVYGGAERQKALLATELDRRGYPVTIVCVQRFGPMIKEIPDTVRVVRQPWWAPIVDIPAGPAVLITADTNTEAGFATLWGAAGRNRRWLVAPHVPPEEDRPIYSRPLTAAMRRADGFIVLAQRHWDMLAAQHRLWGRRFIAPNGVVAPGDPAPRVRSAGEPPHLVMLSRILEHKNPHVLIEALGDLADMPWTLSIFGDGPDRQRLQARTPSELRERVQWRGWSAGPGPALADADLLCVPSRSEAFPLVILEAMARAVPVAASAICAVPEMLDFGRAGFLVEPVSVSGWRDHLGQILAAPDELPSIGQRGFERMHKYYTVEAMTDAYLDAIHAIV
jgi:glycosyltransferase involved in cell wall biosynthesis